VRGRSTPNAILAQWSKRHIVLQIKLGLRIIFARHELDNQGILDGEDTVVFEVLRLTAVNC
jgi:hypothetical protein